jgi:hypothetical protein
MMPQVQKADHEQLSDTCCSSSGPRSIPASSV